MLSIDKKLLLLILLVSSAMTTLFTLTSLYHDYHAEMDSIEATLSSIERNYLESLNIATYQLNEDQSRALLKGIAALPMVDRVSINSDLQVGLQMTPPKPAPSERLSSSIIDLIFTDDALKKTSRFPLQYQRSHGHRVDLGELIVDYNLRGIYSNLSQRSLYFFVSQGLKTLLVALILLFFIRKLITEPIRGIASYFRSYEDDLKQEGHQLRLPKRIWEQHDDELDYLAFEINGMDKKMRQMLSNLEKLVADRTQELTEKKAQLESNLRELETMQGIMITNEKLASLGQLSTGLAHEIRNPLHFIKSSQEILAELFESHHLKFDISSEANSNCDANPEEITNDCCAMIAEGVQRIDSIVNTMLSNVRSELDKPTRIALDDLLQESLKLAASSSNCLSLEELIIDTAEITETRIQARPGELRRALASILENAIFAVAAKREQNASFSPMIKIKFIHEPNFLRISITDNGVGIPPRLIEKVMNPFFTTKNTNASTGLGLFLTNEIIRSHGGHMEISSVEGESTEIRVFIPHELQLRTAS